VLAEQLPQIWRLAETETIAFLGHTHQRAVEAAVLIALLLHLAALVVVEPMSKELGAPETRQAQIQAKVITEGHFYQETLPVAVVAHLRLVKMEPEPELEMVVLELPHLLPARLWLVPVVEVEVGMKLLVEVGVQEEVVLVQMGLLLALLEPLTQVVAAVVVDTTQKRRVQAAQVL
jgi:hypothetical protein